MRAHTVRLHVLVHVFGRVVVVQEAYPQDVVQGVRGTIDHGYVTYAIAKHQRVGARRTRLVRCRNLSHTPIGKAYTCQMPGLPFSTGSAGSAPRHSTRPRQ